VSPAGTSDRALFSYASFHDTFPQFIAHPIAIAFSRRFRASSSGYRHRWEIERKLTMNRWLTAAMQLQHQSDGDEPGRQCRVAPRRDQAVSLPIVAATMFPKLDRRTAAIGRKADINDP
jgi:hypothetical protein